MIAEDQPRNEPLPGAGYAFAGFGALGRQVAGLFLSPAEREQALFFDDVLHAAGARGSRPFGEYGVAARVEDRAWIVGLGYKHLALKERLLDELARARRTAPVLVHPGACVHPSAQMGAGTVVYPLANVDQGVILGSGVLLNNSVVVSHDTRVGNAAFLAPGVVLCGGVRVGARCFLGAGSVVADGVGIGEDAIVGIGSVVTRDVPAGASVIGNPLRVLDRPLRLK